MPYRFADIYLLLCVQWKTPDDGRKKCPKHVEFYYKNKFENLVHLVCFVIRMFDDILIATQKVSLAFLLRICISHISCKL